MSRENVEVVRQVYEAAGLREAGRILELYDPNVELDRTRLELPDDDLAGVYRGHDGLRRFFRDWHQAWENVKYDYDELIDAGAETVISMVTRRDRGRASGAVVEFRAALLWTVRRGKVVRVVWYRTREDALAAAGSGR